MKRIERFLGGTLRNNLEMIKDRCKSIHENRYLLSFTNHDFNHSERMIELITSLCINSTLLKRGRDCINEYETFILLAAIYLHDIGMQVYKVSVLEDFVNDYKAEYPQIENEYNHEDNAWFVRKYHHLLSGYWVGESLKGKSKLPKVYFGDIELAEYVRRVIISHGVDFSKDEKYIKAVDYEGKSIRMDILCALLSLADALDCDKRRIDYEKLKYSNISNASKIHWMKHYYCNSVRVKDRLVHLSFQFPEGLTETERRTYELYFPHETQRWIQYNSSSYIGILSQYHLNFNVMVVIDYGKKDVLDEEQYLAIEAEIIGIAEHEQEPIKVSPQTVAIGILEKDGDVVLVRRRQKEDKLEWQFPAGIVKANQKADLRVVEEFADETGIQTNIERCIGMRIHPNTKTISIYYALRYVSGELKNGDIRENSDCKWVSLAEYKDYITSDLYLGVKRYLEHRSKENALRINEEVVMDQKVVVGIVTMNEQVLLVKRKPGEGDLVWQFPGGTVEGGETIEQAVVREVKEETGTDVKVLKVLGERVHPYTKKHMSYIACEYVSGDLQVSDNDLEKAEWIEITKVNEYFTTSLFETVQRHFDELLRSAK